MAFPGFSPWKLWTWSTKAGLCWIWHLRNIYLSWRVSWEWKGINMIDIWVYTQPMIQQKTMGFQQSMVDLRWPPGRCHHGAGSSPNCINWTRMALTCFNPETIISGIILPAMDEDLKKGVHNGCRLPWAVIKHVVGITPGNFWVTFHAVARCVVRPFSFADLHCSVRVFCQSALVEESQGKWLRSGKPGKGPSELNGWDIPIKHGAFLYGKTLENHSGSFHRICPLAMAHFAMENGNGSCSTATSSVYRVVGIEAKALASTCSKRNGSRVP